MFCRHSLFFVGFCELFLLFFMPVNVFAANAWNYVQESDRLTNRNYSVARSPLPRHDLYDNMRLEVVCKDNVLQAIIEADSLIASQDSRFDVEYQIDQKPPIKIQMTTFKDSKRRGYTSEHAQTLVTDMLAGQAIFIRVNTLIREVLSGAFPLNDALNPLTKVLSDCGIAAPDKSAAEQIYRLSDFEQDFGKLTPAQQQQLLGKIKKMIMEMH
jgi:hypothetical protein